MHKRLLLIVLLLVTGLFYLNAQKDELKPYTAFLKQNQTDPVEYVFQLFEKYDIVVLGERDHRDTTQYELINKIISDQRFIDKVGKVFTEVGMNNQKENLNHVLKGNYKSESDFDDALMKVYVDMQPPIIWEKYNYWMLLKHIYNTNKQLSPNQKVTIYPTNPSFDFKDFAAIESFYSDPKAVSLYDSIMASHFIKDYEQALSYDRSKNKKALVIMNRPHSYRAYDIAPTNQKLRSVVSYLVSKYPEKVANVMINSTCFDKKDQKFLVAQGRWDAAFRSLDNPSVGFDFEGSPFGNDSFDQYDKPKGDTRYENIYTGFIFYKPIEEWKLAMGIPGFAKEEFMPELIRRTKRLLRTTDEQAAIDVLLKYNQIEIGSPYNIPQEKAEEYINYWLK